MYLTRNSKNIHSFWGADVQAQRMDTVLKHCSSDNNVLDLGSGRGAYTSELTKKSIKVVGVDTIFYSEWTSKTTGNFLVGNGIALPFRNKVFDTTIAFEVLEHILDPALALKEIARCTKDKFIFSVPNCDLNNTLRQYDLVMAHWSDPTHCNFFTKESLAALLLENHFEILEMKDCYRVSANNYYWDSLRLPRIFTRAAKRLIEKLKLSEEYWSSILVVSRVPRDEIQ